jgi:hypothetical protein
MKLFPSKSSNLVEEDEVDDEVHETSLNFDEEQDDDLDCVNIFEWAISQSDFLPQCADESRRGHNPPGRSPAENIFGAAERFVFNHFTYQFVTWEAGSTRYSKFALRWNCNLSDFISKHPDYDGNLGL